MFRKKSELILYGGRQFVDLDVIVKGDSAVNASEIADKQKRVIEVINRTVETFKLRKLSPLPAVFGDIHSVRRKNSLQRILRMKRNRRNIFFEQIVDAVVKLFVLDVGFPQDQ